MLRRLFLLHILIVPMVVLLVGRIVWPDAALGGLAIVAAAAGAASVGLAWAMRRIDDELARRIMAQTRALAEGTVTERLYGGATNEVRALAAAFNDMSDRLAERLARLEGDRDRLRAVLGGMVEGVIALDADGAIIFSNDRAGQLLDFSPRRSEGKKFWEVVRQRPWQQLVTLAMSSREPQRGELEWPSPSPRSLAVYAAPLNGSALAGLIVVIHDVSDIRRLERLRHEFVANVSHELKTPLAVIKACVETLQEGAADNATHRARFLQQINEQSDRLHALILDILKLASVESGGQVFAPTAVSVEPAVEACLNRHRARAEAKRQVLRCKPPALPLDVAAWTDPEAFEIILDNLVDNAINYTPEGGQVEIRWGGGPANIWLEVADTGIGIPEADLPRIFERFFRVDKARARELGGTGLGLSIVKHLANAMNGSVSAQSTLGHGSVFTVRLPIAP